MENRFITTAPEAYDYWYVRTVETKLNHRGKEVRVIEVDAMKRFEGFQRPRYSSGLHACYPESSVDAEYLLTGKFREGA